jgi:hypothetical protein
VSEYLIETMRLVVLDGCEKRDGSASLYTSSGYFMILYKSVLGAFSPQGNNNGIVNR